jgi:uncharacterized membrane protein YbhN (UPF0104 family)
MKKKLWHNISFLISVFLFILALVIIHHKLKQYHYRDIVTELAQIPAGRLLIAVALTVLDYLVLTAYDALALRYIRHRLKYRKIALASFVGYAFSHNATILGGSAARYRIYSRLGISASEVAKLVIFCLLTYWLGFFAIGGIVFVLEHENIPAALHLPFASVWPIGVIFLAIAGLYVLLIALRRRPLKVGGRELPIPSVPLSFGQIAISSMDWFLSGSVLYVLLPATTGLTCPRFLAIFLLAQAAGLLSYIPGGLGVFETVILLLLSEFSAPSALLGSLLLYRLIYYVLPLGAAAVLLAVHEILPRKKH